MQLLGTDCFCHQVGHEARVVAALQAQHDALEASLVQLTSDELADDPAGHVRVDGQLIGQLE